jgi:hypothetical protein
MKYYCHTKKELLKDIDYWLKNLKGELQIKIKKDKALKNTYLVDLFDEETSHAN